VSASSMLLIFGLVVAITIAGIIWSLGQRQRRGQRFADASIRLGLSFEENGRSLLETELGELRSLAPARINNFEILNLMRGQFNGYDTAVCDYHYWNGIGGDREDYYQTMFFFRMAGSSSPDFALRAKLSPVVTRVVDLATTLAHYDFPTEDSGTPYWVEKKGKWMAAWRWNMRIKQNNWWDKIMEAAGIGSRRAIDDK